MSSSYRMELDKWLGALDVKADKVLDIGGSQLPVKGRTKSWEAREYLIADLPQPHADSPKPDITLDMNYCDHRDNRGFDLIFCLEVFDYVWDPREGFDNLFNFMRYGASAWVTFPAVYPAHNPIEDDSLRYMEGGIKKLADSVGLEILQMIKRRPESNFLDAFWRAERMRAAKHYDHNFTGWIVEFTK